MSLPLQTHGDALPPPVKTPSGTELDWRRISLLAGCVGVGLYFWDSALLLPIKLIVVMMHESGHALATWLVGGEVDEILLRADQSGQCLSRLPASIFGQVIVYSAGYLGSAVAGAGLLLATLRFRLRRAVLAATSLWLSGMGILYGGDFFTVAFCLGTAGTLMILSRILAERAVDGLNLFLAGFSSLYALVDLREDLWDSTARASSDAALLAERTWIPALLWAVLWTLAAAGLLTLVGWRAINAARRDLPVVPDVQVPLP